MKTIITCLLVGCVAISVHATDMEEANLQARTPQSPQSTIYVNRVSSLQSLQTIALDGIREDVERSLPYSLIHRLPTELLADLLKSLSDENALDLQKQSEKITSLLWEDRVYEPKIFDVPTTSGVLLNADDYLGEMVLPSHQPQDGKERDEELTLLKSGPYKMVSLSNYRLNPETWIEVVKAIQHNQSIQSLDVSSSKVTDEIAIALSKIPHLTELDLSNNAIGDAGALAFSSSTTLRSLNLSGNMIGLEGKNALGGVLSHMTVDYSDNWGEYASSPALGGEDDDDEYDTYEYSSY